MKAQSIILIWLIPWHRVAGQVLTDEVAANNGTAPDLETEPNQGDDLISFFAWCVLAIFVIRCAFRENKHVSRFTKNVPLLLGPYFRRPGRIGCAFVIALMLLIAATIALDSLHNAWDMYFWDSVQSRAVGPVVRYSLLYLVLAFAHTIIASCSSYARIGFALDWRDFESNRLLRLWLREHAHFVVQLQDEARGAEILDSPDQRIQEDVQHCAQFLVDSFWDLLVRSGHMVYFGILLIVIGPVDMFGFLRFKGWVLWFVMLDSLFATAALSHVSDSLFSIKSQIEKAEARFRRGLVHIHEHSESIAISRAAAVEQERSSILFQRVMDLRRKEARANICVDLVHEPIEYLRWMLYVFILLPAYLSGEISFGGLYMLSDAASHVSEAFKWFQENISLLLDFQVSAERILEMSDYLNEVSLSVQQADVTSTYTEDIRSGIRSLDDELFRVDGLEECLLPVKASPSPSRTLDAFHCSILASKISLPSGEAVWHDLRLEFTPVQRVLISGAEGIGKSILFKVAAGAWPYASGCEIRLFEDTMFLPQKPIIFHKFTLGETLAYPSQPDKYSDSSMADALLKVGLQKLLNGRTFNDADDDDDMSSDLPVANELSEHVEGDHMGLHVARDWHSILSGGMMQRLAFAQCILRQPRLLFLGESTCHLSKSGVVELYESLYRNIPDISVVSISHDVDSLERLHNIHYLVVGSNAKKRLVPIRDLAADSELGITNAHPGQFVAVFEQGEWNEALLCARLPNHEDFWLGVTTDEDGNAFVWTVVEVVFGRALLVEGYGKNRKAGFLEEDEVNWICTPPDCETTWCPRPNTIQIVVEGAARLLKALGHMPVAELKCALEDQKPTLPLDE